MQKLELKAIIFFYFVLLKIHDFIGTNPQSACIKWEIRLLYNHHISIYSKDLAQ